MLFRIFKIRYHPSSSAPLQISHPVIFVLFWFHPSNISTFMIPTFCPFWVRILKRFDGIFHAKSNLQIYDWKHFLIKVVRRHKIFLKKTFFFSNPEIKFHFPSQPLRCNSIFLIPPAASNWQHKRVKLTTLFRLRREFEFLLSLELMINWKAVCRVASSSASGNHAHAKKTENRNQSNLAFHGREIVNSVCVVCVTKTKRGKADDNSLQLPSRVPENI